MFRILLSMTFYVVFARWIYSEAQLVMPTLTPKIDFVLAQLQVPTHDKWDREKISKFFGAIEKLTKPATGQQIAARDDRGDALYHPARSFPARLNRAYQEF